MAFRPELYVHDLDKTAFEAFSRFPETEKLRELCIKNCDEQTVKNHILSDGVQLGKNNMPEIYHLLPPICEKLGIDLPELYCVHSSKMHAAVGGCAHPFIYITSALAEQTEPALIASVLAHECGHIADPHFLYYSMAIQIMSKTNDRILNIPDVDNILTPSLSKALQFWAYCSELTADRAAVLCDGSADHLIKVLLKIHGYDPDQVNQSEFFQKALNLDNFADENNANQIIDKILSQEDSQSLLATRLYESNTWAQSEQYHRILKGTYSVLSENNPQIKSFDNEEIINAEVQVETSSKNSMSEADIQKELVRINSELDRYTNHADRTEYALAVGAGIVAGIIDAVYVGETTMTKGTIGLSHKQVNHFIQEYAKARGIHKDRLKDAISELEKEFKVDQDNVWKGANIRVSAKNHHLADLAHHPTPAGLLAALIVQFLRIGIFVNRDGEWHFVFIETSREDIIRNVIPAVITAILNWLVTMDEQAFEEEYGHKLPENIHRIAHLAASTPILIEIAKCADNWFGHLVSDMGGSKNTAGAGMGIPGVFISLFYEIAALPILKDTGLPETMNNLYQKQKIDLRHELAAVNLAKKQAVPVLFVEIFTRVLYFVAELIKQTEIMKQNGGTYKDIDWQKVIPFNNRSVNRMLTIASMTFTTADTTDAAVHAALKSKGNWILFSGKFAARYNYVGAGRATYAIVKEISSEKKKAELIHEKLLLTEIKKLTDIQRLREYEQWLTEQVTIFLAEDITEFMNGFNDIQKGIAEDNSNQIIKGNVTIQKILGRDPQFTNQKEFDALMDSDEAFIL